MIVQDFLFRKCRRGICRVSKWIVSTYFLYQVVCVMWFTHTNNIVRGLVGGDNNIFVMKERQMFSKIWVFNDWCSASAHRPTEFFNSNLIYCHMYNFRLTLSTVRHCALVKWCKSCFFNSPKSEFEAVV